MKKHRKTVYTISNVAAAYDIHPQTLRLYEKHGLLKPSRSGEIPGSTPSRTCRDWS